MVPPFRQGAVPLIVDRCPLYPFGFLFPLSFPPRSPVAEALVAGWPFFLLEEGEEKERGAGCRGLFFGGVGPVFFTRSGVVFCFFSSLFF